MAERNTKMPRIISELPDTHDRVASLDMTEMVSLCLDLADPTTQIRSVAGLQINTFLAHAAVRMANYVKGSQTQHTDEKDLKVGSYYWVRIVFDPDAVHDWENESMPARYAGDGKWFYPNQEEDGGLPSDWPVRWIGCEIPAPLF